MQRSKLAIARSTFLIILTFVSAAVAGGIAAVGTPSSHRTVTVVIGIPSANFEFLPVLFANYSGFWKNYNLNATLVVLHGESQLSIGVSSGSAVIGLDSAFSVVGFVSQGLAVKVVAQVSDSNDYVLVVRSDQPYSSVSSLNNTRVGVISGPGVAPQIIKNLASLYKINLTEVQQTSFNEQTGALANNKIQSFVTTYDDFYGLQSSIPGFRSILNFSSLYPQWKTETVIFARKDFINSNPSAVLSALKGIFYAMNYMRSQPQYAVSFASAYLELSPVAANLTVTRLLGEYQQNGLISTDGLSYALQFDQTAGIVAASLPGQPILTVDQIYTNQFTPVKP